MPLTNRVTPFGEIVADPARGSMMGNRGILHDAQRRIVRDWQVRRWIACRLEFRGRHRPVMQPGHYTELFFLDEAAALADGHRPCAECRNADFRAFQRIWASVFADQPASADAIDIVLHRQRRSGRFAKRTFQTDIRELPDGTYIALEGRAWLVLDNALHAWSIGRYVAAMARPRSGQVAVLTPAGIVEVLRAGYRPGIHMSTLSSTLE